MTHPRVSASSPNPVWAYSPKQVNAMSPHFKLSAIYFLIAGSARMPY